MNTQTIKIILVCIAMLVFSCQDSDIAPVSSSDPNVAEDLDRNNPAINAKYGGKLICFYDIEFGRRITIWPSGNTICINGPGICSIRRIHCIWIEIPIFNPCDFIPCLDFLDPWEIYEKFDPEIFKPFIDYSDKRLDPETTVTPFKVAKNIIGLQYNNEIEEVLNKEVMILEDDFELSPELMESLDMEGKVIPAGKYPVIFNEEAGTYNVLASVK